MKKLVTLTTLIAVLFLMNVAFAQEEDNSAEVYAKLYTDEGCVNNLLQKAGTFIKSNQLEEAKAELTKAKEKLDALELKGAAATSYGGYVTDFNGKIDKSFSSGPLILSIFDMACKLDMIFLWVSKTPFGSPVVPDV